MCAKEELEGVLSPLDIDESAASTIESLPYLQGRQGISSEIADTIDARLAAQPGAKFLKVDRARLDESCEAWVHVVFDAPASAKPELLGPYFGSAFGFGAARGVLTWSNSD